MIIENPTSCHSVTFQYSIAGSNPGSLSLKLTTTAGDSIKQLWSADTSTNDWVDAEVFFRYYGAYKVCYSIKFVIRFN